jgi:hypothetical protein
MSVGSADVHKAIAAHWISSGLNALFLEMWDEADRTKYTAFNDAEAAPGTPFPYVVFAAERPSVQIRMSSRGKQKRHINDQTWTFEVYAVPADGKSAKQVAAELGEEILKVFGGHPENEPSTDEMELDNGNVLLVQYQTDHFERQSDEVWKWFVEYKIKTDTPVMV